jgi:hypothetical protein
VHEAARSRGRVRSQDRRPILQTRSSGKAQQSEYPSDFHSTQEPILRLPNLQLQRQRVAHIG